jgi:putative serine protease PepD
MSDGGAWRQPDATAAASGARDPSPWWSDALNDPWRDPEAPAVVLVPAPPAGRPPEPVAPPAVSGLPAGRMLVISLVTAVVAGAVGGTLGYTAAGREGEAPTQLGAPPAGVSLLSRHPGSLADVAEQVLPSVVTVRSSVRGGFGVGSGFVVSTEGHVITNDHVLGRDAEEAVVSFHDGSTAAAAVVGRDAESDLAVLRVERANLVPVRFGDSNAIAVGDPVLAFGSPLALTNTVTYGIVSAVDRAIQSNEPGGPVRYYAAIQTDAAVNRGNSGGPLVDEAGQVIGINSVIRSVAMTSDQAGNIGLAFAIPINHAQRVASEIIDTGRAHRTVIGAELDGDTLAAGGVRLAGVVSGGPAALAGLRAGDVLLRLGDRPLSEPLDVVALVRKHAPGEVIAVEYRRGSARSTTDVTLAADAE